MNQSWTRFREEAASKKPALLEAADACEAAGLEFVSHSQFPFKDGWAAALVVPNGLDEYRFWNDETSAAYLDRMVKPGKVVPNLWQKPSQASRSTIALSRRFGLTRCAAINCYARNTYTPCGVIPSFSATCS
jgi:hypothetical protein